MASTDSELSQCTDPELLSFLDGKKRRLLDLTEQMASLFFSYQLYGESPEGWQGAIFKKLKSPDKINCAEQIICFGIDFLPPLYWDFLFIELNELFIDILPNKSQTTLKHNR